MLRMFLRLAALCLLAAPMAAAAWWNEDWSSRTKINLNTTATGAELKEAAAGVPVLVRLHTGNFIFLDAKEDGSDIRFIDADDKTPLKHHIESFDAINELALIWVQVPQLAPGAEQSIWMYYGNQEAVAGDDVKGTYDAAQALVLHFAEGQGAPVDSTAYTHQVAQAVGEYGAASLIGKGYVLAGGEGIALAQAPSLAVGPNGLTVSMWIKTDNIAHNAVLFSQRDATQALQLVLANGKLSAQSGNSTSTPAGEIVAGRWHHVALSLTGAKLSAYLDGVEIGSVPSNVSALAGTVQIGAGFIGEIDEVQLAYAARNAAWIAASALAQGPDQKLISFGEGESAESGGDASYMRILLDSLTLDGWIVVGILMVMMIVSFAVMIGKAMFVSRMDKANAEFKQRFEKLSADLVALDRGEIDDSEHEGESHPEIPGEEYAHSSLYRIYHMGVRELKHRYANWREGHQSFQLSPQAIDAIRATLDAGMTREAQRLNSQMVLLTISIAGGPFLGLLGTVVGVMITFAAIAAAGDVNVNSIAPGIAAALIATVAGLAVAIPALFGYNYLSSRINNLTADMQVFADELLTKLAENYSN